MGLFDFFKKTPTIEHPFFGTLTFMEIDKDSEDNYFEGSGIFEPLNQKIEFQISGNLTGSTVKQEQFYKKVQRDYELISKKCASMIEAEYKNWKEDFKIKDFNAEFTLVGISIPNQSTKPLEWHLAFDTVHDENHMFTVYFIDFEPDFVTIDG